VLFDNGNLYWSNTQSLADPTDTSTSTAHAHEAAVQGGTGDFRHAHGSIFITPLGENTYDVSFDISCDY
jgi:hypothetical protein